MFLLKSLGQELVKNCKAVVHGFNKHHLLVQPIGSVKVYPLPRMFFRLKIPRSGVEFKRFQFPVRVGFAITSARAQSQEMFRAVVDVRYPPWGHGQLNVMFSRVKDRKSLLVLVEEKVHDVLTVRNVVYDAFVQASGVKNVESTVHRGTKRTGESMDDFRKVYVAPISETKEKSKASPKDTTGKKDTTEARTNGGWVKGAETRCPNIGNTCYIAVFVQVFGKIPAVQAIMTSYSSWQDFVDGVRALPGFTEIGREHDICDLFETVRAMSEEIQLVVGVCVRDYMKCDRPNCGFVLPSYDEDSLLRVNLQTTRQGLHVITTIEEALEAVQKEELVRAKCSRCNVEHMMKKRSDFSVKGDYLIVQVKRFTYHGGVAQKLRGLIRAERTLEALGGNMELVGVVVHVGENVPTGHYIAYKKLKSTWYKCNDSHVAMCDFSTEVRITEGYMYLYKKM